ncbi:MAG TPA: hypothetical protein PKM50_09770 [Methanoregula sp.]|nr:hypothetical protein [Methanoregula sp.]
MSTYVKFRHTGVFHSGDSLSIDLDKISEFKITRLRNTCELLAITPENHQSDKPDSIATRDRATFKDLVNHPWETCRDVTM